MTSPELRSTCAPWLLWSVSLFAQSPEEVRPPETVRHRLNEPQLAVVWAPDGGRVICSGQNRAIRQFDPSGKELDPLRNGLGGWATAFAPSGRLVAVCGLDRSIRIWDPLNGEQQRQLDGHQSTAWVAAFLPDGLRLLSVGEDATIRVWHAQDGKELRQIVGHPGPIWCMAISPDGRWLATGGSDGVIRLWDLLNGIMRRSFEGSHIGGVWPLTFSPDGRAIASAGWQDGKVLLWETATGRLRRLIPHPSGAKSLAFTRDGRTLVTAGNDAAIRFWDLLNGLELPPLEGHRGVVNGIAISPDGKMLASASADTTFRLWELTSRTMSAKNAPAFVPAKQIEAAWASLARDDAKAAFDAICLLSNYAEQSMPLMRKRLQPASTPDVDRISHLITSTNHAKYTVRERATAELVRLGEQAEPHLLRAVHSAAPPETHKRVERALNKLQSSSPTGGSLQQSRAVEVLERINSADSRELLQDLAAGASDARLTLESRAALARIR